MPELDVRLCFEAKLSAAVTTGCRRGYPIALYMEFSVSGPKLDVRLCFEANHPLLRLLDVGEDIRLLCT